LLARVLEALDTTKQAWTKRGDAAMLLNVAHCVCGAPFHSKRYTSKGRLYEYYDCSAHCGERRIPMVMVERVVEDIMTNPARPVGYASYPVWRKSVSQGKSIKGELNKIERKIRALDLDDETTRTELMTERKRLLDADKSEPSKTTYEKVPGMTVGAYWPTLDKQSKRQLLLEADVTVHVIERAKEWKGRAKVDVMGPVDVRFIELPTGGLGIQDVG
jgi:hypothetical protein